VRDQELSRICQEGRYFWAEIFLASTQVLHDDGIAVCPMAGTTSETPGLGAIRAFQASFSLIRDVTCQWTPSV